MQKGLQKEATGGGVSLSDEANGIETGRKGEGEVGGGGGGGT
jgi:hypothetical protein